MDVAGSFTFGNRSVPVMIDYFSKWSKVYAIPNQEANTIVNVFVNNWVCCYGVQWNYIPIKAEISNQMYSRKCVWYTVLNRLERHRFTHSLMKWYNDLIVRNTCVK